MPGAGPPVFITGRFRSGSTLLWQIFDRAGGFRAFYEPCHDNLIAHIRYTAPMATHRGVDVYWESYLPIAADIERLHKHEFGLTRLVLEASDRWDALDRYLRFLIDAAGDLTPVLQFNRIDLRLPWIRARFPEARIIHLYRDPRESFASAVRHLVGEPFDDPARGNVYDLLEWSVSLFPLFPFLGGPRVESLYERLYYLWKLSFLAGRRHADCSLSFDDELLGNRELGLEKLVSGGYLKPDQVQKVRSLIQPVERGRWSMLHKADWFETTEAKCERTLDDLGLNEHFGKEPLCVIRERYRDAWSAFDEVNPTEIMYQLLMAYSKQRSEVTRLLHHVRAFEREREASGAR